MEDDIVSFDGHCREYYGPRYIRINGTLVPRNGSDSQELFGKKIEMLQYQMSYAQTEEEKQWFKNALERISTLQRHVAEVKEIH